MSAITHSQPNWGPPHPEEQTIDPSAHIAFSKWLHQRIGNYSTHGMETTVKAGDLLVVFLLFMVLLLLAVSLIVVGVVMVSSAPKSSSTINEAAKATAACLKSDEVNEGVTTVFEEVEPLGETTVNGNSPQSQSIFMRLPPELRYSIYKALLKANTDIRNPVNKTYKIFQELRQTPKIHTAILTTCKAIHEEAHPLLYSLNHLHFSDDMSLRMFCETFGAYPLHFRYRRQLLRSATVCLSPFRDSIYRGVGVEETTFNLERHMECSSMTNAWRSKYFPGLRVLTLDFTMWCITAADQIPDKLMEIFGKAIGHQLEKLDLVGLETQPELSRKLREALLANPD